MARAGSALSADWSTPLAWAARLGHTEFAEILWKQEAPSDWQNNANRQSCIVVARHVSVSFGLRHSETDGPETDGPKENPCPPALPVISEYRQLFPMPGKAQLAFITSSPSPGPRSSLRRLAPGMGSPSEDERHNRADARG